MSSSSSAEDTLRVGVERRGKVAVVKLAGSANMDVSAGLQDQLIELVDEPIEQLIVDLAELEFISSVGLGAIIAAHLHCRHHDGVVKLVAPRPSIRDILEVTRLTRLFGIYDSVEAALAAG